MSKYAKFTTVSSEDVYLNLNNFPLIVMNVDGQGTLLNFGTEQDSSIMVKESVEEVLSMYEAFIEDRILQ